jgi:hypothetical protein
LRVYKSRYLLIKQIKVILLSKSLTGEDYVDIRENEITSKSRITRITRVAIMANDLQMNTERVATGLRLLQEDLRNGRPIARDYLNPTSTNSPTNNQSSTQRTQPAANDSFNTTGNEAPAALNGLSGAAGIDGAPLLTSLGNNETGVNPSSQSLLKNMIQEEAGIKPKSNAGGTESGQILGNFAETFFNGITGIRDSNSGRQTAVLSIAGGGNEALETANDIAGNPGQKAAEIAHKTNISAVQNFLAAPEKIIAQVTGSEDKSTLQRMTDRLSLVISEGSRIVGVLGTDQENAKSRTGGKTKLAGLGKVGGDGKAG